MNWNDLILIFNALIALICSTYMLYYGIKVYRFHQPARRTVYIIIGVALAYHVFAYSLAIFNVVGYAEIPTEAIEFTTLVRPLVSIFFLAPVAVDMVQRKFGGLNGH